MSNKKQLRWTKKEDEVLLRYVKAMPHNLSACFLATSEQVGRTTNAVRQHWYNVLSKKPEARAFGFISPDKVGFNRKNSEGTAVSCTIWNRLLKTLKTIFR